MIALALVLGGALAMEPLAALAHRRIMHGRGWAWHRGHHGPAGPRLERNDWFPVCFAAVTILAMAIGSTVAGLAPLLWLGAGVTAYGLAYLLVHDVCLHGRVLGRPVGRRGYLGYVRRAHRIHHVGGAEPYGFLAPITPARARARTAARLRSPDRYDATGRPRSVGSVPSAARATTASLRGPDTVARRENTS